VTAAIFGLLGVVVGGLLNGAAGYWLGRRKEQAEAKVGARLVRVELNEQLGYLGRVVEERRLDQHPPGVGQWEAYRAILARELDDRDWAVVAECYIELADVEAASLDPEHRNEVTDNEGGLIVNLHCQAYEAWEILEKYGPGGRPGVKPRKLQPWI
jgi:hypothetical protein